MAIAVVCPNGHRLKANEKQAGKSFPCPACGQTVMVPSATPTDPLAETNAPDPLAMLDLGSDLNSQAWQTPALPAAPLVTPGIPARKSDSLSSVGSGPPKILWIAGASGGAGLVLVMLLIVVLAIARSRAPKSIEVALVTTGTASTASSAPSPVPAPAPVAVAPVAPSASSPSADSSRPVTPPPAEPVAPKKLIEDQAEITTKLRRIALGFHNFHDKHGVLAFPYAGDSNTTPTQKSKGRGKQPTSLSWRVHLLPFLEQKPLYDQFHLDEPWDSAHNKQLLELMPEVFRIGSTSEPTTRFQVVTGPNMMFGNQTAAHFNKVSDGLSNTILALVVGPDRAIPWTKPDELTFDEASALNALGTLPDGLLSCVMVDVKPLVMKQPIDPATLVALATPAGSEIVDAQGVRRKSQAPPAGAAQTAGTGMTFVSAPPIGNGIQEKLQAIGLAFLLHRSAFNIYTHPEGSGPHESGLSWRVHLLPFLGEGTLYAKFHLNEPWDSAHNKTLLDSIPAIYRLENDRQRTRFRVFTGPKALLRPGRPIAYNEIKDGISNTILAAAVGPELAVPWTQPESLPCEASILSGILRSIGKGAVECVMADGSLLSLAASEPAETLEALATTAGGEIVDVDALRKKYGPDAQPDKKLTEWAKGATQLHRERMDKLKSLSLAMLNYSDHYNGRLPLEDNPKFVDEQGRAKLSWRVHLLRYLDQDALFKRFKLDEAWDSPQNRALLDKMPDVYRDPLDPADSTTTRFMTLTGPDTMFPSAVGMKLRDAKDGSQQTIEIMLMGSDKAVPWTKPDDAVFNASAPWACAGTPYGPGWYFVLLDGAVRHVKTSLPPDLFKALVTPAGGEKLPPGMKNYGFGSP